MGVRRRVRGAVGALLFTLAAVLVAPEIDASRALASGAANASAPSYLETRIGASEIEGRALVGALGSLSAEERSGYAVSSGGSAAGEHLRVLVHNGKAGLLETLVKGVAEGIEHGNEVVKLTKAGKAATGAALAAKWSKTAWRYTSMGGRRALLRGIRQAGSLSAAKAFVRSAKESGQRRILLRLIREAPTLAERKGIVYGYRQMRRLGYELVDATLAYSGRQGLDMAFRHRASGSLAVLEAKHGRRLKSLATYSNLRQGSSTYNVSRLLGYLQLGDGRYADVANRLLAQAQASRLQSFASLYRSRRLYELPGGWPALRAVRR